MSMPQFAWRSIGKCMIEVCPFRVPSADAHTVGWTDFIKDGSAGIEEMAACAGSIPEELGALSELKDLRLHSNKLTGKDVKRRCFETVSRCIFRCLESGIVPATRSRDTL